MDPATLPSTPPPAPIQTPKPRVAPAALPAPPALPHSLPAAAPLGLKTAFSSPKVSYVPVTNSTRTHAPLVTSSISPNVSDIFCSRRRNALDPPRISENQKRPAQEDCSLMLLARIADVSSVDPNLRRDDSTSDDLSKNDGNDTDSTESHNSSQHESVFRPVSSAFVQTKPSTEFRFQPKPAVFQRPLPHVTVIPLGRSDDLDSAQGGNSISSHGSNQSQFFHPKPVFPIKREASFKDTQEISAQVSGKKRKRPGEGSSCHHCKNHHDKKKRTILIQCCNADESTRKLRSAKGSSMSCFKKYCSTCIKKRYNEDAEELLKLQPNTWECPACRGICACKNCVKKRVPKVTTTTPSTLGFFVSSTANSKEVLDATQSVQSSQIAQKDSLVFNPEEVQG